MFLPKLVWHNVREYLNGERPFGFWDWKSNMDNVHKQLIKKYQPIYYWSSNHKHFYKPNGMPKYNIYTISTYNQKQFSNNPSVKPIDYVFKDREYFNTFKNNLMIFNKQLPFC